jgi:4-hydroxysphinganine ceramide fatty acyl 2-hydroxylase
MPYIHPTYSAADLSKAGERVWVSFEGKVYDVTEFVEDHPGGAELLEEHRGRDITEAFMEHRHSEYARTILADYQIGILQLKETTMTDTVLNSNPSERVIKSKSPTIATVKELNEPNGGVCDKRDDKFLDTSRPLMQQVWKADWKKEYYLEQVHIPRYTAETPKFFENAWLDGLTKNVWYGVLLVWVPVVLASLSYAYQSLPLWQVVHLFVDGIVLWSIYEYVFHRFIFHMETYLPSHRVALTAHFLVHGVHHFLPMDRYRLVMPPFLLAVLATPTVLFLQIFFSWEITAALMAGSFSGYICYDMLHYYAHHGRVLNGYLRRMKAYHMDHHYIDYNMGYGVSSVVWDTFFGTMLPVRSA